MSNLQLAGELLTASEETRILSYKLLPYDSQGSTNLGKVTASKGTITVPDDVTSLPVNEEHDYRKPVGRFTSIEEREDGLYASVYVIDTQAGNDALKLAASGLRKGISVEIDQPVIRSGALTAGILSGAGLVVRPAFPNAQLVASDFGDLEEEAPETPSTPEQDEEEETAEAEAEATTTPEKEIDMSENATVPTELQASNAGAVVPQDLRTATNLIAKAYKTRDHKLAAAMEEAGIVGEDGLNTMFAALSNITNTAHKGNIEQGEWLGELWSKNPYSRKYVSLVSAGTLTDWKVEGWRFLTTPTVGDYAGDLAEIPSNTVTTEAYSVEAERIAGGWKIDRKYADFGNSEFLNSFFSAAAQDYALKTDQKLITRLSSIAVATASAAAPAGVNPFMSRIVDGVLAVNTNTNVLPSFALVAPDVYRSLLLTRSEDSLQYLSSALGFVDGTIGGFRIVPAPELAAGTILVGAKEAVAFYELPGSPIRVDALDINKGGLDEALFGYFAVVVHNANGIRKV